MKSTFVVLYFDVEGRATKEKWLAEEMVRDVEAEVLRMLLLDMAPKPA